MSGDNTSFDPSKYEKIGEQTDQSGTKVVYVRSRSRQGFYSIPDYVVSPSQFKAHKAGTNVIGILSTVFMFLTMMGAVTAAWVTMSERQAKTETYQQLKFEAYQEVLGGIKQDVEANRRSIDKNRREIDSRLRVLMETNNSINVQLARIQSLLEKRRKQ